MDHEKSREVGAGKKEGDEEKEDDQDVAESQSRAMKTFLLSIRLVPYPAHGI